MFLFIILFNVFDKNQYLNVFCLGKATATFRAVRSAHKIEEWSFNRRKCAEPCDFRDEYAVVASGGLVFSFLQWACQSCSCKIALNAMRLLSDGTMRKCVRERARRATTTTMMMMVTMQPVRSHVRNGKKKKKRESLRAK